VATHSSGNTATQTSAASLTGVAVVDGAAAAGVPLILPAGVDCIVDACGDVDIILGEDS
jgi:hypothetical protein